MQGFGLCKTKDIGTDIETRECQQRTPPRPPIIPHSGGFLLLLLPRSLLGLVLSHSLMVPALIFPPRH